MSYILQNFLVDYYAIVDGKPVRGSKLVSAEGGVSAIHVLTSHFFHQGAPVKILRCRCFATIQGRKPDLVHIPRTPSEKRTPPALDAKITTSQA